MLHGAPSTSIKRPASTRHYPIGPDCLLSPFSARYSHYRGWWREKLHRKSEREGRGACSRKYMDKTETVNPAVKRGGMLRERDCKEERDALRCIPNAVNSCRILSQSRHAHCARGRGVRSVRDLISGTC